MRLIRTLACAVAAALVSVPGMAAINASALGAAYDAGHTSVNFKVYSSRATRIELWLYASASGSPEKLKVTLTKGTGNIWTANVTTSALTAAGPRAPASAS
jgi:isoamylase